MSPHFALQRGFSLTELVIVVAMAGTLMAVAVPLSGDLVAAMKLNEASRLIEREFADARLRAVSSNRPLRVRTNCPAAGFVRTVEFTATSADAAANRCLNSAFPLPADNDLMTLPNYDGPVRSIPAGASVATITYQFQPDGTVFNVVNNVITTIEAEQTVTISRRGKSRTVKVNSAGKIELQ
jgi:prepilin-type N-terminal cleavage/methylation domain-containing protein